MIYHIFIYLMDFSTAKPSQPSVFNTGQKETPQEWCNFPTTKKHKPENVQAEVSQIFPSSVAAYCFCAKVSQSQKTWLHSKVPSMYSFLQMLPGSVCILGAVLGRQHPLSWWGSIATVVTISVATISGGNHIGGNHIRGQPYQEEQPYVTVAGDTSYQRGYSQQLRASKVYST